MAGLRQYKSLYSSTSSSFGTGEGVTITPSSVVGLPSGVIVLTFDRVDSSGVASPTKMERIKGTVSGSNFVVASGGRGFDGSTEQAHTSPVVEMVWNATDWNDAVTALTNVVSATTGALDTTKVVDLTTAQVMTHKDLTDATNTFPATIPTASSTTTFTNKRITKRVATTTDSATAAINCDTTDEYQLSAVANATTFTVTGTPTDGQKLLIRYKDAGVAKGLTFTGFTALGATIPTITTAGKWGYVGASYNLAATTWHIIAVATEA